MKLSSIKTADQLILALASAGYRKEPANGPISDTEPGPFYVYGYMAAARPVPEISIYPQQLDHSTDLFVSVVIDEAGNLTEWELFECYVGSCTGFDPVGVTTDPESIGELLQDWHQSLCGSQG